MNQLQRELIEELNQLLMAIILPTEEERNTYFIYICPRRSGQQLKTAEQGGLGSFPVWD